MPLLSWIKNKSFILLVLLVVILILRSIWSNLAQVVTNRTVRFSGVGVSDGVSVGTMGAPALDYNQSKTSAILPPSAEYAPQPNVSNRMVIEESNLSLLVKNVMDTKDKIITFAQGNGGYMVSSHVSNPQDAPSATVVVRVRSDKLKAALDYLDSLAVKVVSENLSGQDVTDQYVDIDKNIAIYEATKVRFEEILKQAQEISDITNLNREIINIQAQIDSLKGRQEALKQNAQLAKLTIYLSTDEIALPYAPSETWRPEVIFKMAVRSLVKDLRSVGTNLIWIGVYGVIWLPLFLVGWLIWRKLVRQK